MDDVSRRIEQRVRDAMQKFCREMDLRIAAQNKTLLEQFAVILREHRSEGKGDGEFDKDESSVSEYDATVERLDTSVEYSKEMLEEDETSYSGLGSLEEIARMNGGDERRRRMEEYLEVDDDVEILEKQAAGAPSMHSDLPGLIGGIGDNSDFDGSVEMNTAPSTLPEFTCGEGKVQDKVEPDFCFHSGRNQISKLRDKRTSGAQQLLDEMPNCNVYSSEAANLNPGVSSPVEGLFPSSMNIQNIDTHVTPSKSTSGMLCSLDEHYGFCVKPLATGVLQHEFDCAFCELGSPSF